MSQEEILFEKALVTVNSLLKTVGLQLNEECNDKSLIIRLRKRSFFCFAFVWMFSDYLAEVSWFVHGAFSGKSMLELTYPAPAIAMVFLSVMKVFFYLYNELSVYDLISTLRRLQSITASGKVRAEVEQELVSRMTFLTKATSMQYWWNVIALLGFAILPFIIMAVVYSETGQLELMLPYVVLYPFDVTNPYIFPFMYLRQMWTAKIAVFMLIGVDSLFYACSTYIQIQFRYLSYDLERIISWTPFEPTQNGKYEAFRGEFSVCMKKHTELIRCVSLMERIYSKSTLINVVTSSMLICLTGFNATAMESWYLIMPFIAFVGLVSGQIFLFCYFGDIIMRSSTAISDAVYSCQWYKADVSIMKDLKFVLTRAQKPCKLTAYGFSDINLNTFTRILSTAWSYFALLSTVNRGPPVEVIE